MSKKISPDMRVREVIEKYPETYEVFRRHGCPDMRKGIYAVSARFMKVRWAAKAHKIPVEALLEDLNAAAGDKRRGADAA